MGIEEEKKRRRERVIFLHLYTQSITILKKKKKKRYWPSKESDRFSKTLSYPAAFLKNNNNNI
jgi:hypothetical protein